jgi:Na+/H+ antiporter NhaC
MLRHLFLFFCLFSGSIALADGEEIFAREDFEIDIPPVFVSGIETEAKVTCTSPQKLFQVNYEVIAIINGQKQKLNFVNNEANFKLVFDRQEPMSFKIGGFTFVQEINPMPLWVSIIPPLLVIGLALVFKEVISSLVLGIICGGSFIGYYSHSDSAGNSLWRLTDTYLIDSLTSPDHAAIIMMSLMIGGVVALISKNGGMQAIVDRVSSRAKDPKGGQFATWFMGIAIFFDDYANTLVVGNTMRPLTDSLNISRAKLSYIVDSTAAPVAAIAFVTTWIGAELGYIEGALEIINAGGTSLEISAYGIFLSSLQYAFYPFLCLIFIVMIIYSDRDFGPMWRFEKEARLGRSQNGKAELSDSSEDLSLVSGVQPRMFNAILPILTIVLGTLIGLAVTGYSPEIWHSSASMGRRISEIVGASDSYKALIWSSSAALGLAIFLTWIQRVLSLSQIMETMITGFKSMLHALVIVVLAWSLASITETMYTANFIASLVQGNFAYWLVPGFTFLISAAVAFSTGSSWGSMAIVYPLFLPLSWELSMSSGIELSEGLSIFCNVASCVLAGAVLGDHCSPISDTTILSSLATQCDHVDHVRTQMPYALTVGAVALLLITLAALGWSSWLLFPLGMGFLYLILRLFGKKVSGEAILTV